ncbi:MAG: VCBS repeat-containing protein [Silicimonas sp.]|nr:VCBS repeat-containing protein [Silicimonas sp.]
MWRAGALVLTLLAGQASAEGVASARYEDPTTRYAHGILGDAIEHGALVIETTSGRRIKFVLPASRVFEDTEPRVVDVDGDGAAEVVVVETHTSLGARLAVYDETGLIAANDYIGQRNRWLAPAGTGAADLDGDGRIELIYVDRPHLAKTLRIYEYRPGELKLEASFQAVTNHRIGESDIAGGIRKCADVQEVIVADANWREVLAIRWDGKRFDVTRLGPHMGRESFAKAMSCN